MSSFSQEFALDFRLHSCRHSHGCLCGAEIIVLKTQFWACLEVVKSGTINTSVLEL